MLQVNIASISFIKKAEHDAAAAQCKHFECNRAESNALTTQMLRQFSANANCTLLPIFLFPPLLYLPPSLTPIATCSRFVGQGECFKFWMPGKILAHGGASRLQLALTRPVASVASKEASTIERERQRETTLHSYVPKLSRGFLFLGELPLKTSEKSNKGTWEQSEGRKRRSRSKHTTQECNNNK